MKTEGNEIKGERRINSSNLQQVLGRVAVKSEFFRSSCFPEEHFYQVTVTKATRDQAGLRIRPTIGSVPPPGGELLSSSCENQHFGRSWALPHCHLGEKRPLGCPPHYKPHGGSVLAFPTLGPVQAPALHLEAITPPVARFPGGGTWQWRFSIISLPQRSPASIFSCHSCNCCTSLRHVDYDLSNIFLKSTHFCF